MSNTLNTRKVRERPRKAELAKSVDENFNQRVILSGVPSWAKAGRNAVEGPRRSLAILPVGAGVLRLRYARPSASAPLRMTRFLSFHTPSKAAPESAARVLKQRPNLPLAFAMRGFVEHLARDRFRGQLRQRDPRAAAAEAR